MNLIDFYKKNIKEDDYYYKYFQDFDNYNNTVTDSFGFEYKDDYNYDVFDIQEAIERFKGICYPPESFSDQEKLMFIALCYYFKSMGYSIDKFPDFLERPKDVYTFSYTMIRNKIHLLGNFSGTVSWEKRRQFINELKFTKKNNTQIMIDDLKSKILLISTRGADFDGMPFDEQLKEIANLLEYIGKENDKFVDVNYENITSGILDVEKIKEYRKQLQCFRHASKESISERKLFDENQKKFLIDFGIVICNHTYYYLNHDKKTVI